MAHKTQRMFKVQTSILSIFLNYLSISATENITTEPRPPQILWRSNTTQHSAFCNQYLGYARRGNFMPPPPQPREIGELSTISALVPKNYDKIRPPTNNGQPTVVLFHVTVLNIDGINEESMTYETELFVSESWKDERLLAVEKPKGGLGHDDAVDADDDDYKVVDVELLKNIWRPDSFFKNAKSVKLHEHSVPNHFLWLYDDKTLLYMSRLSLKLSCPMKFQSFPHDTQTCSLQLESLSHKTKDVVFKWDEANPLVVNPNIELPQFEVTTTKTDDCTFQYSSGNYTCLELVTTLKRRFGYHFFHTYFPSTLLVVISWISFWIRGDAVVSRIIVCVTSLLLLVVQNVLAQSNSPRVGYVKAIDVWLYCCISLVFTSLMEYAVVLNLRRRRNQLDTNYEDTYELDSITDTQSEILQLPNRSWTVFSRSFMRYCSNGQIGMLIDRISRIVYPIVFVIFNVIYWGIFLY